MRRLHVCSGDTGSVYRTWACNVSKHWDCRNSHRRREVACGVPHVARHTRASDMNHERPVTRLFEAARSVVVRSRDEHVMPTCLQGKGSVHHKTFCATDAEVRMYKRDAQCLVLDCLLIAESLSPYHGAAQSDEQ